MLRLGAVTGVGHARLILERFGKFWGAFSVIDLFILNGLTIVTEFIGVNLALGYLGASGDFERFSLALCFFSVLLVPVFLMVHPPIGEIARDLVVPHFPAGAKLSDVMLLVIAIVGTTVAPWQLFFQQSYVIDKRITPRFMIYGKADLLIGIGFVVVGAVAMMAFAAAAFGGTAEFGQFTDAGAVAAGLEVHAGRAAGGYVCTRAAGRQHHRGIRRVARDRLRDRRCAGAAPLAASQGHRRRGFYLVYAGLIAVAAALVLFGSDALLGLLTNAVQTLAGVLLPSATVFLLLLCNDEAVLGPWMNGRWLNLFTGAVIWILLMLSIILTTATVFPGRSGHAIVAVLGGGTMAGAAGYALLVLLRKADRHHGKTVRPQAAGTGTPADRASWRMPPLNELPAPHLSPAKRIWMALLRAYLVGAVILVAVKVVQIAAGQ